MQSSQSHSYLRALLLLLVLAPACTRRFDPHTAPELAVSDDQARAQFDAARSLFDRGDLGPADHVFADLAAKHGANLELQGAVALYRGRIALRLNRPARAYKLLAAAQPRSVGLTAQTAYYRGLAAARTDKNAEAVRLLSPQLGRLDRDARAAALAALARAEERLPDPLSAIRRLEALHTLTDRPVERAFAVDSIRRLLAHGVAAERLPQLQQQAPSDGVLFALLLERRIRLAQQAGDSAQVRALALLAADSREAHGLAPLDTIGITPTRAALGVLLPHSGRYRALTQRALEGIARASGALGSKLSAPPLEVLVRDSSERPGKTAEELINRHGVVALLGLFSGSAVAEVAQVASRYGVPLLCLAPSAAAQANTPFVLQLLPDNAARARQLARAGLAGSRPTRRPTAAILSPNSAFGRQMSASFSSAWRSGGGQLSTTLSYPPNDRVFTDEAARLARLSFDVLFVPERASRLGLISAALARAGIWPSGSAINTPEARRVRLLVTADGLSARLLQSARRYLQGATLAPGFYRDPGRASSSAPGPDDGAEWRPGLIAAVAHDGTRIVRAFLAGNQPSSSELMRTLGGPTIMGLSGRMYFGDRGLRSDPPLLYTVRGDRIERLANPTPEG